MSYSRGVINIPNVTGDIVITAVATRAELLSITAVYTQSGTVYDTDSLDSLKSDLVVTATYADSSTATVTDYTLSGTLAEGTSTVTVSYGGKTDTISVVVTGYWDYVWSYTDGLPENNGFAKGSSGTMTVALQDRGLYGEGKSSGAYVRYSPSVETVHIAKGTIEVVFSVTDGGSDSNGVRIVMSNGTDGINVRNNPYYCLYMTGANTSTQIASLSADVEYTERIEYEEGGTQKIYLNGTLIHSATAVSTSYTTRSFVYIQDNGTKAYLKSMKWHIEN